MLDPHNIPAPSEQFRSARKSFSAALVASASPPSDKTISISHESSSNRAEVLCRSSV